MRITGISHHQISSKYLIFKEPGLRKAADIIESLHLSHVLTIFLRCEVLYNGRAKSKLSKGDRLLILKPDGTLLIHGGEKREPINWQPPGCVLETNIKKNTLVLRSIRRNPREIISIRSDHIYVILATIVESGEFILWGSEKEMIDYVIKHPEIIEKSFRPLDREFHTPFGKIDLIGKDKRGRLVVLEFKRSTAQLSAVSQLLRYVDGLKIMGTKGVRGILVAPKATHSALELLKKYGLEFRELKPTK